MMQGGENRAKRESQSLLLLQKLIRLDSKDCNFHFRDELHRAYFRVAYQHTNTDNNSNDGLLRQLWHHVYAHYFKKIEAQELKRLQYARLLLGLAPFANQQASLLSRLFPAQTQFQQDVADVLSPKALDALQRDDGDQSESALWLKQVYAKVRQAQLGVWSASSEGRKSNIIYSKLRQNRKRRLELKSQGAISKQLKADHQLIDNLIGRLPRGRPSQDPLDRRIRDLEEQMEDNIQQTSLRLEALQQQVDLQVEEAEKGRNGRSFDLKCIRFLIEHLEEKQIAESVSKVVSTERGKGQQVFQVQFEKAMNVQPKLMTEKQLLRVNQLRETSLLHFYRTGVKSPYSYVCHNYIGFRELMQSRMTITAKMKDKDMLQLMKKGICQGSLGEVQQEMHRFFTCHHCKFLLPQYLLFHCKFTSDKQALPKMTLEASNDPNLAEANQLAPQKGRTSQRFMTRKKNCLTSYAKIHDQYVCGRMYCFSCLKDSYSHENIRENGHCPFCLGVCICTRCLRNEKIAKFKNTYAILGGNLDELTQKSSLNSLQVKNDDQIGRGRGRPRKHASQYVGSNGASRKIGRYEQREGHGLALKGHRRKGRPRGKKNDHNNSSEAETEFLPKKKAGRPRIYEVERNGEFRRKTRRH